MIETLWITNPDGDTLELDMRSSDTDHGLLIFNMTGLGPPKATVSGTAGPGYDGIRGSFVRADARHMVLTLAVTATGADEEIAKQLIYDYFPIKETIILGITSGAKDVYTEAFVETNEMAQFAHTENAVIGLYCGDPYWLDLIIDEDRFLSDLSDVYPFLEETIVYGGDRPVGVQMEITIGGGGSEIIITNDNGAQSMTIDLNAITQSWDHGARILIDTRVGQKSIILEIAVYPYTQYNILYAIGLDQDWIQLNRGNNNVQVSNDGNPDANSPDDALIEYIPMYRTHEGSEIGLHTGQIFIPFGGPGVVSSGPGINADPLLYPYPLYKTARLFDATETARLTQASASAPYNPTGDFSISIWFKVNTFDMGAPLISVNEHSTEGYEIALGTPGTNYIVMGVRTSAGKKYGADWSIVVGDWHNFFVWYDVSAGKIYASLDNGLPKESADDIIAMTTYSSKVSIGGALNSMYVDGPQYFDGLIGPIMFFDRVLTDSEQDFVYNTVSGDYGRQYCEIVGDIDTILTHQAQHQGV